SGVLAGDRVDGRRVGDGAVPAPEGPGRVLEGARPWPEGGADPLHVPLRSVAAPRPGDGADRATPDGGPRGERPLAERAAAPGCRADPGRDRPAARGRGRGCVGVRGAATGLARARSPAGEGGAQRRRRAALAGAERAATSWPTAAGLCGAAPPGEGHPRAAAGLRAAGAPTSRGGAVRRGRRAGAGAAGGVGAGQGGADARDGAGARSPVPGRGPAARADAGQRVVRTVAGGGDVLRGGGGGLRRG